jgi:hypothetical protein
MHPHKSHFETMFPDLQYLYMVTDNCIAFMDRLLFINAIGSCHYFHGSMTHPVLLPVWQMYKKTITHHHIEKCLSSDVQHFGLSISHHHAQVKIRERTLYICKIVIVEPVHLMDHHNISVTLDDTGMLGLWEQQLVTCHLYQYFDSGK